MATIPSKFALGQFDLMEQIGKEVEYRRNWDAVVLNVEQMGCAAEEVDCTFVEYLQYEAIEWMPDFEWGNYNTAIGWDMWETEKGRHQRNEYINFWQKQNSD